MLDDERLVELLVKRDDLLEQGREATPEEVCEDCPELVDEYKAKLEALKRTEWLFETNDGEEDDSVTTPVSATVSFVEAELPSSSLTIEQFLRAITDSGLMTAEEIQALQQSVSTESSSDTQSLARELVQRKKLTLYQASVLLAERSDPLLLDRYVILDTIDSGGMGLVFKALHRSLDRVVALKTLPPTAVDSEDKIKRFQREARTAAKLSHPNIVTTHDAHESNGVHFLIMEYVKGENLRNVVKAKGPLPVAIAVDYMLQAARGLEHAHSQGIIHRDIKPGNLLLDANGTVKVLDLGLARLEASNGGVAETEEDLTAVGGVMGTAAYMSPEQGTNTHDADARSDVYSLGCTLYYLLTGEPPYKEDTFVGTILAHRERPIPALSEDRDDVPEDVIGVYRRMMAKKPEDRYQSMTEVIMALGECEVAEDKRRAVGQSVAVLEETTAYSPEPQKRKWLWAVAMLLAAVVIVLGIVLKINTPVGTLVVEVNEPDAEVQIDGGKVNITTPGDAQPIEIEVDEGKHTLKVSKGGFETHTKEITVKSGDKEVVAVRLVPTTLPSQPAQAQSQPPEQAKQTAMPSAARTANGVGRPPSIRMVRGFRLGTGGGEPQVIGMDLLAEERSLLVLSWKLLQKVDLDSGAFATLSSREKGQGNFSTMALTPDRRKVVLAMGDGSLSVFDLQSESVLWQKQAHRDKIQAVSVSGDARRIVTGSHDRSVRIWDIHTGAQLAESSILGRQCYVAAFMPDHISTVLGGSGAWLEQWNVQTDVRLKNFSPGFPTGNTWANPLLVNDGRQMLSGYAAISEDITESVPILLWDLSSSEVLRTYNGHTDDVTCLKLLPDGRHFTSGSTDRTFRIWSLEHERELYRGEDPAARTDYIVVVPDSRLIVTGGLRAKTATKSLFLWELPDLTGDGKAGQNQPQGDRTPSKQPKGVGPAADQEPSATMPEPSGMQPPPPAVAPFNATEAREHQQAWADHLSIPVEFENSIGMKMVLIPPGDFLMGSSEEEIEELMEKLGNESDENCAESEKDIWARLIQSEGPQHLVRITTPSYLCMHEVTVGQFRVFIQDKGYTTEAEADGEGGVGWAKVNGKPEWEERPEFNWENLGEVTQTDRNPVVNLSWNDTVAFCKWLSEEEEKTYDLPTEAQWEHACRAGSTTKWSFGDNEEDLNRFAWCGFDGMSGAKPVGQKPPNGFGLFDMHGNVSEWCSDRYSPNYYAQSHVDDPSGPASRTASQRSVRDGAFHEPLPYFVRTASRRGRPSSAGNLNHGFRPIMLIDLNDPKPTEEPPAEE